MNPEHAAENVNNNGIVARASWLYVFGIVSRFYADGWGVDDHFGLRGVLKNAAEGGASEKPLEDLIGGKAVSDGRGIAVVHQKDVSPGVWTLLTAKR